MSWTGDEVVGMVRHGRVELPDRLNWPDGASVRVVLVDPQPTTPEAIEAWCEALAAAGPIPAEDADEVLRVIREGRVEQARAALAKEQARLDREREQDQARRAAAGRPG